MPLTAPTGESTITLPAAAARMGREGDTAPSSSSDSLAAAQDAGTDAEKADVQVETVSVLPLRPTLRDRWNHLTLRALPQPHYLHPQLTRARLALLLAALLLLALLLLAVVLPVVLARRRAGGRSAPCAGCSPTAPKDLVPLPTGTKVYQGDGTYYGTGLGACGITSADSQMVVAVAWQLFDSAQTGPNPNLNPLCGRKVRAWRTGSNGSSGHGAVEVTVVDRCTGCHPADLDFSITAFEVIADKWEGRVSVQWAWV